MNWKATLCALCVSVSVAGCGGGGGGGSDVVQVPTSDPISEVRALNDAAGDAFLKKDLNRLMNYYSDRYHDTAGNTKANLRNLFQEFFQDFDLVGYQSIGDSITLEPDGSVVTASGGYYTARVKQDGSQVTVSSAGASSWVREGNTWRVINNTSRLVSGLKKADPRNS